MIKLAYNLGKRVLAAEDGLHEHTPAAGRHHRV